MTKNQRDEMMYDLMELAIDIAGLELPNKLNTLLDKVIELSKEIEEIDSRDLSFLINERLEQLELDKYEARF